MRSKLTIEITSGNSLVQVYGKRSARGWVVTTHSPTRVGQVGTAQAKKTAIQMALDAATEDPGRYLVKPKRP